MRIRKGQSILEYAVLICVVLAALLVMQVYIKRTYQGRLKTDADSVGEQYSPGHTTSVTQTNTSSNSTTYTGGEFVKEEDGSKVPIPYGMTVSKSSSNSTVTKREGVDSFATEQ
jgi:cytoskeletal protein RodZ